MKKYCCKSSCINKFTVNQVKETRQTFIRNFGSNDKQRQYIIIDWLNYNRPQEEEDTFVFSICGISVCLTCWWNVLGITRRNFFQIKKECLITNNNNNNFINVSCFLIIFPIDVVECTQEPDVRGCHGRQRSGTSLHEDVFSKDMRLFAHRKSYAFTIKHKEAWDLWWNENKFGVSRTTLLFKGNI